MGSSSFLLVLVLSIWITQLFHQPMPIVCVSGDSTDLIQKTCKTTKYYDLCVSSLRSNCPSSKVDTKGLAIIMVRVGIANATATNSYLSSELVSNSTSSINDASRKKMVKECADKYRYAGDALQASLQDLGAESYDYAYMHVMAASDYPNACRIAFKRFPGLAYPPQLARMEDALKRICDVVLAIIDTISLGAV